MKTKYTYTTERRQTHCHLPAAPSSFARSLTEGAVHHTLPFFAALRQGLKKGLAKRDCVKEKEDTTLLFCKNPRRFFSGNRTTAATILPTLHCCLYSSLMVLHKGGVVFGVFSLFSIMMYQYSGMFAF